MTLEVVTDPTTQMDELKKLASAIPVMDFDAVEKEFSGMRVSLPLHCTPLAEVHDLFIEVQGYRSRVASVLMGTISILSRWYEVAKRSEEVYHRLSEPLVLSDDVKSLKNSLQEAKVNTALPEPVALVEYAKRNCLRYETWLKFVQTKLSDLESINNNLSRQWTIRTSDVP